MHAASYSFEGQVVSIEETKDDELSANPAHMQMQMQMQRQAVSRPQQGHFLTIRDILSFAQQRSQRVQASMVSDGFLSPTTTSSQSNSHSPRAPRSFSGAAEAVADYNGGRQQINFEQTLIPFECKSELYTPTPSRFGISSMRDCVISISGFTGAERMEIKSLVALAGAQYTGDLSKSKNTHLIVLRQEGEKYTKALEWGMQVVSRRWLEESILRWARMPESDYRTTWNECNVGR
eukprot:ANDGO_02993.mRNA.1 BRCT domain-containing protein At4g02110